MGGAQLYWTQPERIPTHPYSRGFWQSWGTVLIVMTGEGTASYWQLRGGELACPSAPGVHKTQARTRGPGRQAWTPGCGGVGHGKGGTQPRVLFPCDPWSSVLLGSSTWTSVSFLLVVPCRSGRITTRQCPNSSTSDQSTMGDWETAGQFRSTHNYPDILPLLD